MKETIMSDNADDIDEQKATLREQATKHRKEAFAARPDAGSALVEYIATSAEVLGLKNDEKICSVYWPMGSELDTRPLLEKLLCMGHQTCLPVVEKRDAPLIFRAWSEGDELVSGGFGTSIPETDAPVVTPSVLFVPMLAFDLAGYRLGYGGGFYDRTLAKLRSEAKEDAQPIAIGVAFSAQEVDTIPKDGFDQALDWVVTEAGLWKIKGKT